MALGSSLGPEGRAGRFSRCYPELWRFSGSSAGAGDHRDYPDATGQFTNVFILGGCLLFLGACLYGFFVRKPLTQ